MSTFSPLGGDGIRPENPVADQSLGNLFSTIAQTGAGLARSSGGRGPTARELDSASTTKYFKALEVAQQARESGQSAQARRIARSALVEFRKEGGDPASLEEAHLAFTGQSLEDSQFDTGERLFQEFRADPAFSGYVAAADNQLGAGNSMDAINQRAFEMWYTVQKNTQITEINKGNWETVVMPDLRNKVGIALRAAKADLDGRGDRLTDADVSQAEQGVLSTIMQYRNQMPAGADPKSLDNYQTHIQGMFDVMREVTADTYGQLVTKKVTQNLLEITLDESASKGERQTSAIMLAALEDNPSEFLKIMHTQLPDTIANAAIVWDRAFKFGDDEAKISPPPEVYKDGTSNDLNELITVMGAASFAPNWEKPESVQRWANTTGQFLSTFEQVSKNDQWWGNDTYRKVFNPEFFKNLSTLKDTDPTKYKWLLGHGIDTLSSISATLLTQARGRMNKSVINITDELDLVLNIDTITRPGNPYAGTFVPALRMLYGDNLDKAFKAAVADGGRKFIEGRAKDIPTNKQAYKDFKEILGRSEKEYEEFRQIFKNLDRIKSYRNQLNTIGKEDVRDIVGFQRGEAP